MVGKKKFAPIFTLCLGMLSGISLLYTIYHVGNRLSGLLDLNLSGYIVGIGYIIILLFHFFAIFFLISRFQALEARRLFRGVVLVSAVVSLFAIAAEKVMFDEIGRELRLGVEVAGEVFILTLLLLVNLIFVGLMSLFLLLILNRSGAENRKHADESVFTVAQYMGIASGVMGTWLTLSLLFGNVPGHRLWIYLPFYLLFTVPYGISVLIWLIFKRKEKITSWYDEKQLTDLSRSALVTMLVLIPALVLLLLAGKSVRFYWFPYFLFVALTIFSAGTLYFFKKK